jgi:Cu-Zn family superoxide dismutase
MRALWILALGFTLGGCATLPYTNPQATADLKNAKGEPVGVVALLEDEGGVRFFASVRGLPAGKHGIHIHGLGKCEPPEFTSAGGHFNPTGKKHGLYNPQGPHAGDLPNLDVGADGTGQVHYVLRGVTLGSGPTSLLRGDGTSVVIHANADDYSTDPAGNSGARIACGVIQKKAS